MQNINKATFFVTFLYFLIALYYSFFLKVEPSGDENYFVNEFTRVGNTGLLESIKDGISIPFVLLNYFPYKLLGTPGVRLMNVILTIIFLIYVYNKTRKIVFVGYVMFYMATVIFFFRALNDTIFSLSLAFFFIESYFIVKEKSNPILGLSAIVIALFTRNVILIYAPLALLVIFLIHKKIHLKKLILPSIIFFVFLMLNIPSLKENSMLSYDNKKPPEYVESNWIQRQYLSQLYVNQGKLKSRQHVSWDVTDKYLKRNGQNSLPSTSLKNLTFNINLTIKEFFKDVFYTFVYSVRQIGISFLLLLLMFFKLKFKKKTSFELKYKLTLFVYALFVFSFIVISNVELRWLAPIFLVILIPFKENTYSRKVLILNNVIFMLLSFYGAYKLLL